MGQEAGQNATPEPSGSDAGGSGVSKNDQVPGSPRRTRSDVNTANATKHGYYSREKKLTTRLIEALVANYYKQQRWLEGEGLSWVGWFERPPLEELCEGWREDMRAFVDYVIEHHGARTSRNQYLVRRDDSQPWSPENVLGWELRPPKINKRQRRVALARDPLGALLDCACDHRAQSACARSARPCDWAAAARDEVPWTVVPEPPD